MRDRRIFAEITRIAMSKVSRLRSTLAPVAGKPPDCDVSRFARDHDPGATRTLSRHTDFDAAEDQGFHESVDQADCPVDRFSRHPYTERILHALRLRWDIAIRQVVRGRTMTVAAIDQSIRRRFCGE